jgi:hypothetical protein
MQFIARKCLYDVSCVFEVRRIVYSTHRQGPQQGHSLHLPRGAPPIGPVHYSNGPGVY